MKKLADGILKLRWFIIGLVVALTLFLGFQIRDITINSDVITSLPDDDPDAVLLRRIGDQFGGNRMGMIILETDDIFKTEVLEHLKQISDTLRTIEGISSVTSLVDIIDIKGGEYGIEVGKLVDEWELPETPEELAALRERVNAKEMYKGNIVSEDESATLIIFTLPDDADMQRVAKDVKAKTESLDLPEKIYFSGSPMMVTAISELLAKDSSRLIPIAVIVIALILFLSFHSIRGVVLPLLTSTIAVIWTIGLLTLTGFAMSMTTNNIPIILLAIGSAYTIHVLNRIIEANQTDKQRAIKLALGYIFVPVFLSALTTAIGFTSFIFGSYLTMIRDFGIFAALGTLFASLLSLFFIPAIRAVMPAYKKRISVKNNEIGETMLSRYVLVPLKNLLLAHPKYILTTWSVMILLGIGGLFIIKRSVDIKDFFKKDNPTRIAENIMTEKFGGTKPISVLFEGDMHSPDVMKTMILTEDYMKESPDITSTQSVADLIVEMNGIMGEERAIPEERAMIEQLWFLLDGNDIMSRFVNDDLDQGIIISKFVSPDNQAKKTFTEYMRAFIEEHSTDECKISITGMPFVDVTMDTKLVNSQIGSLSIAIIFLIIIVGLFQRSFLKGIYATIPIVAAVLTLFAFMGITGIPLNVATVLVASIVLGMGIDYSIHILTQFSHSIGKFSNVKRAVEDTILISGKAIFINVVSVSAGFLILLFSQMVPLQYFGLLIAFSMFASGLGALTLLPVILILVYRNKN